MGTISEKLHIERISEQNLGDFMQLYQRVFGKEMPRERALRKYGKSPVPHFSWLGFIGYRENKPVTFIGGIAYRFRENDVVGIGVLGSDYMTHPDHRGQHLFDQVYEALEKACREAGIDFMFGLVTGGSEATMTSRGWKIAPSYQLLKVPVFPGWMSALQVHKAFRTPPLLFENSLASAGNPYLMHDADFYAHKYLPYFSLEKGHFRVWGKFMRDLWIGDFQYDREEDLPEMIAALKAFGRRHFVRNIIFQLAPSDNRASQLLSYGNAGVSYKSASLDMSGRIHPERVAYTFGDLDSF